MTVAPGENRVLDLTLQSNVQVPAAPPPTPTPTASPAPVERTPDFVPMPDRWRLQMPSTRRYPPGVEGEFPRVEGRTLIPYNQNTLKGDRPAIGQETFLGTDGGF